MTRTRLLCPLVVAFACLGWETPLRGEYVPPPEVKSNRPMLPEGPLGPLEPLPWENEPLAPGAVIGQSGVFSGGVPAAFSGMPAANPGRTLLHGAEGGVAPLSPPWTGVHDGDVDAGPGESPHAPRCNCPACASGRRPEWFQTGDPLPVFMPPAHESWQDAIFPQIEEDWFGRPLFAGGMGGYLMGDEILADLVEIQDAPLAGVRFGRMSDGRWIWETRLLYAESTVENLQGAALRRDADVFFGDTSLLYSPRYGKRLRPFVSAGLGAAYFDFTDHLGQRRREFVTSIPVGAGFKYRIDDWLVLQLDVRDNIILGRHANLATMHSLTLGGSLELRFGGSPRTHHPWNPSRQLW